MWSLPSMINSRAAIDIYDIIDFFYITKFLLFSILIVDINLFDIFNNT